MRIVIPLVCSLLVILASPGVPGAAPDPKAAASSAAPAPAVQDLEVAAADLSENIQDLRHNISHWRNIAADVRLTPEEKRQWRQKAEIYLQECEAYNNLLARVDAKKLPATELGRRFLSDRQTFQREVQYFRETLQRGSGQAGRTKAGN